MEMNLRFDGLYVSIESWVVRTTESNPHGIRTTCWRFYLDGEAVGLEFEGRVDLGYKAHHFSKRKPIGLLNRPKRDDICWYMLNGDQITIGLGNQVILVGRLDPFWKGKELELSLPGEKRTVCYSFHSIRLPRDTATETYQKELQLQAPASSAPMQTLPSSTFAQEPITHMTYKIGTIFVTYQQPGSKVDGLAWSPDGRRIASFGLGEVQVWDPLSGNVLYDYKVKGFATIITAIAWSPDSTRVATAGSDKVVQIWDASDGHILTACKGHHRFIRGVSWSPNGQHIASCEDTELHIWNALSGQHILTWTAHPKTLVGMRSLAWSPDATRIASGGGDNHVTVWNPNNGSVIYTYTQQHNTINGLAWSPDGKRIVSGSEDKTVHIWAAETGADPVICQGHTKAVNAVAFSPDGKRVASASDDTTVGIWSSETGQHLFTYEGHKKSVNTLAWSPDGKYIASGGDDKIVQVWTSSIP